MNNTATGSADSAKAEQFLVQYADVEVFLNQDGEPFATVTVNGSPHTYPLKSADFSSALTFLSFQRTGKPPGSTALADALNVLIAKSKFEGKRKDVFVRLGQISNTVYIDLCDSAKRVVEIDANGWRIPNNPPCRFHRPQGMKSLPVPIRSASTLESLIRPFVNLKAERDITILVAWIVAAFKPVGPYPILAVHGEHGTAKSTLCNLLRSLVDPNAAPLRGQPRCEDDLLIAARNSWVIALDNLSSLPGWLSDAMCRLSTGGGMGKRQLYSDSTEIIFRVQRPQILNGIEELASRGDLLSRSLLLELAPILAGKRRTEREFWQAFEHSHPAIFGAALNAVSAALRTQDRAVVRDASRLSDFCQWINAASPALGWKPERFEQAYRDNREAANRVTLEASPLVAHIRDLIKKGPYSGTATALIEKLNLLATPGEQRSSVWPKTARSLGGELARLAPNLRESGILFERERRANKNRDRLITLRAVGAEGHTDINPKDGTLPF